MSQTYRIGSLNFTGSQAVLSASLDVSGSGRFTSGLTVSGSLIAVNGNFQVVTGSTNYLRIFPSTGNTFLGSTPLDGGYKLEVDGAVYSRGGSGIAYWMENLSAIRGSATTNGTIYIDASRDLSGTIFFRSTNISFTGNFSTGNVTSTGGTVSANNPVLQISGSGIPSFRIINANSNSIWYFENTRNSPSGSLEITNDVTSPGPIPPAILISTQRNVSIGTNVTSSFKLDVSGSGRFTNGLTVTGSLNITGSATITDVLTLPFQNPLPSGKPTGSIALSGSGATYTGMFVYDGTNWVTA